MQSSKFSLPEHILEKYVFNNDFIIDGKHYPWLTARDIMQKENRMECEICLWHAPHTPCGQKLDKWKKCKEKHSKFDQEKDDPGL
jgi:Pyruvate/2-oxoacid:ferredoxin oxidoreductase delta subunit